MPVLFICFIVFLLWFRVKSGKAENMSRIPRDEFMKREREANFTRKKDISNLDYITVPEDALPFSDTGDEEETTLQQTVKKIMSKKILNLSDMSNTEIKLAYGRANLDILSEYDQNFLLLLRSLDRWGNYLYTKGDKKRSMQILEYAISIGSDISGTYTTLARIYLDDGRYGKVQSLIDRVQDSNFFMKNSIVSKLKNLMHPYA